MYKSLKINFEIPEILEQDIQNLVDYLNYGDEKHLSIDCYQMEVITSLNYCFRERLLTDEQIALLKDYYIRGGILERD